MKIDYHRVWEKMNDLEMVSTKISSAREILDCAVDRLQEHQYDKAETLLYAVDEYLQYYLEEFDRKFKDAWKETVTKVHQQEIDDCMPPWGHSDMEYLACNKDDTSPECKDAWNSFWEEEPKQDKVVKWRLPVEEVKDSDTDETEYFITFPDDLLEAANLKPGDDVEWVDRGDGSFLLRKTTQPKTYTEMVEAGHTMTADGFWIKE
jgi:hypothetical protein